MELNRFDDMARRLAMRSTRRRAMFGAAGFATVASLAGISTASAQGTPVAGPEENSYPEFLFVQTFGQGSWAPLAGEDGAFTLTLTGVAAQTVYFTDRPEREVGIAETQRFLDGLGFTPANPPNAAVVASREDGAKELIVLELRNPVYDSDSGTLTYDVRILEEFEDTGFSITDESVSTNSLPKNFASGSVFIDGCTNGTAHCYNITNGENVRVGEIDNVGCCFGKQDFFCGLCNGDSTSSYYGMLCNESYPDDCQYTGDSWDCFVDSPYCSGD